MQKKTRTPCVGICSTTYGDEVCRGCKRFYFEVINWNKYDEDEKVAIWTRLESLKTQIIYSKIKKINSEKLSKKIAELDLKIKTDLNEYCQVFDLIKLVSESFEDLSEFGISLNHEGKNLEKLKKELEEELLALSEAHYSKYFKDPLEQKKA